MVSLGSPAPNVAEVPKPPVTTLEPSGKAAMPLPPSNEAPPALLAQARVPSAL